MAGCAMKRLRADISGGFRSRQEWRLSKVSFVSYLGYGMYAPGIVLFLMKKADISLVLAGATQTAATVSALLLSVPAGRVIDLVDPRRVAVLSCGLQSLLLLAITATNPTVVVILVILQSIANRVMQVALGSIVALLPDSQRRTRVSAFMQTASNLGFMIGALLFSGILTVDASAAYASCIMGYAATQAVCAAIISRIGTESTTRNELDKSQPMIAARAITDVPYLATAALCGLLAISDDILIVGIPLWIASHPSIPTIFSASLVALSTGIVAVFQIPFSKIHSQQSARRRLQFAGLVLGAACLIVGASAVPLGGIVASVLLTVGVVVLTVGEMLYNPAKWFLRYDLARESAQGEYGGVFSLASGACAALGPFVISGLIAGSRSWTWPVLAASFAAVGFLSSVPSRRAVSKQLAR
ncbi:MFS transporter [Streptomyces puniciscabiei]